MTTTSSLTPKARRRLTDICSRLYCFEAPHVQREALLQLPLFAATEQVTSGFRAVEIAQKIAFAVAGLDFDSAVPVVSEYPVTNDALSSQGLSPTALSVALEIHTTCDASKCHDRSLVCFLERLGALIVIARKASSHVLHSNVVVWYAERCARACRDGSLELLPTSKSVEKNKSFSFSEAVLAVAPFASTKSATDSLGLYCSTLFLSTVLREAELNLTTSNLKKCFIQTVIITVDVILQQAGGHRGISGLDLDDPGFVGRASFTTALCILTNALDFVFKLVYNDTSDDKVSREPMALELIDGTLTSLARIRMLHVHVQPLGTTGCGFLCTNSCALCNLQFAGLSRLVTFFTFFSKHSRSTEWQSTYFRLLQALCAHVERGFFYRDAEACNQTLALWNQCLTVFSDYVVRDLSCSEVSILPCLGCSVAFLLWALKDSTGALIKECLVSLRLILSIFRRLFTGQSPTISAFPLPALYGLASVFSAPLRGLLHTVKSLEGGELLATEIQSVAERIDTDIYCLLPKFGSACAANETELHSTEPGLLSYCFYRIVTTVAKYALSNSSCCSKNLPWLSQILRRRNNRRSLYAFLNSDFEEFLIGIFLNLGVTLEGWVYIGTQIPTETENTHTLNCSFCSHMDLRLSFLCGLKQLALRWLFDRLVIVGSLAVEQFLPLLVHIVSSPVKQEVKRLSGVLHLCPRLCCLALMIIAGMGEARPLVPAIFRSISHIAAPDQLYVPFDITARSQPNLMTLCVGLNAFGELYINGELGLSKIASMLAYRVTDPFILRATRLRILNGIAEERPDDAIDCLKDIQLGMKDPDVRVRSLAFCCLGRLSCQGMMDFTKVWSILNSKHYSSTILSPTEQTPQSLLTLARFLREFASRILVPNMAAALRPEAFVDSTQSVTLPPSFSQAVSVTDVVLSHIDAQLANLTSLNEKQHRVAGTALEILLDVLGRLIEYFVRATRCQPNWGCAFIRPARLALVAHLAAQKFSAVRRSKTESSTLEPFWNHCCVAETSNSSFSLVSPASLISFCIGVLASWNDSWTQQPVSSGTTELISLTGLDPVEDGISRFLYFVSQPYREDLGRRRNDPECIVVPSYSLLTKALAPLVDDKMTQTFSAQTRSLLRLSTGILERNRVQKDASSSGCHVWAMLMEIIPDLPPLPASPVLTQSIIISFWACFFDKVLGRSSGSHFSQMSVNYQKNEEGIHNSMSASCFTATLLVSSLLHLLHWGAADVALLANMKLDETSLYNSDAQELYTSSGSPEEFLHILYAVTALCCRETTPIHVVETFVSLLFHLFEETTGFFLAPPLSHDDTSDGTTADVYRLSSRFSASCFGMIAILYRQRFRDARFEVLCLSTVYPYLPKENIGTLMECAAAMDVNLSPKQLTIDPMGCVIAGFSAIAERHWDLIPSILRLQTALLRVLVERHTNANNTSTLIASSGVFSAFGFNLAIHGITETLVLIDSVVPAYVNLQAVEESFQSGLLALFEQTFLEHRAAIFLPIAVAIVLLLSRDRHETLVGEMLHAVHVAVTDVEDVKQSVLPFSLLSEALVVLESLADAGVFWNRLCDTTRSEVLAAFAKLRRAITARVALSEPMHTSSFCSSLALEDLWNKRIAQLRLNGVKTASATARMRNYSLYNSARPLADPSELKCLLVAILAVDNTENTFVAGLHGKKVRLEFRRVLEPTRNSSVAHQTVLLLGLLHHYLSEPSPSPKIAFNRLSHDQNLLNSPLVLLCHLLSELGAVERNVFWFEQVTDPFDKKVLCSTPIATPLSPRTTLIRHGIASLSILNAFWTCLSRLETLPNLNIKSCIAASLMLARRSVDFVVSRPSVDYHSVVYHKGCSLQLAVIRTCEKSGHYEAELNQVLASYVTTVFQEAAATDFSQNNSDNAMLSCYPRCLRFRCWGSLPLLYFRLPLSQFTRIMQLGFLSLPEPENDPVLWVFALQQFIRLTGSLCILQTSSIEHHRKQLLTPVSCDSPEDITADYIVGPRTPPDVFHAVQGIKDQFCSHIAISLLRHILPPRLFSASSSSTFDPAPRFRSKTPAPVISSLGEFVAAYIRLKAAHSMSNKKDDAIILNTIADSQLPIIVYAFVLVQEFCVPASILNAHRDALLSNRLEEKNVDTWNAWNIQAAGFATCFTALSQLQQRDMLQALLRCASLREVFKATLQRLLCHFLFAQALPVFYTTVNSDEEKLEGVQPCVSRLPSASHQAPTNGSRFVEQSMEIFGKSTTPILTSKDLFRTESGILFLSQLLSSPSAFPFSTARQPLVLPVFERLTQRVIQAGEETRSLFLFPPAAIFPYPPCFSPTVAEALERLNVAPCVTAAALFEKESSRNSQNRLQWPFEAWLDLMALCLARTPDAFTFDDTRSCLTRRANVMLKQHRFSKYFTDTSAAESVEFAITSTSGFETPTVVGEQMLLAPFPTTIYSLLRHFVANLFAHSAVTAQEMLNLLSFIFKPETSSTARCN